MKYLILFCVLMGTFAFSSPALAVGEYETYFGLDYMMSEYKSDSGVKADLDAVAARFGSYLSKNIALEGRLGFSAADDDVAGVNYELDNFVGLYARGVLPFENVELYGLVGATVVKLPITASRIKRDADDGGLSYGVGVDFRIGERIAIGMEYMMLLDSSDYELTTINLGGKYFF
ncbi:MAG TPA: outer membrane beta-barrel protein [Geopsychrobacteraceae bacterium]|nr:outer membrane beta-barrel protein [Geopsychrobacteraceae bacterium]